MDTVIVSNGQFYSHYPKNIAKGTVDAEAVLVRLDSEWDNLAVRIHWLNVASNVEKKPLLERDQPNTIPWEVLTDLGELRMGLVGLDGETVIKPTIWLTYGYVSDGVDPESGSDPQPPTPSWEQQMVEQAKAAAAAAEASKDAAEKAGEAAGAAAPYAEQANKSAEAAKASQDAADTSAKQAANAKDQANTAATTAQGHANAAERAAETAGNAQSGAALSAQTAANSAREADDAKRKAQKAAAILPAPTQEDAGKFPMVNPEGNGYIFGEAGGGKIDDTTLGRDTTWSSRMIVDSLAPEFEVSGAIVTCTPVTNYPLNVVSKIVPVQSGDGDPSPDNVRPIVGWERSNLWIGGKNLLSLLDYTNIKNGPIVNENGIIFTKNLGVVDYVFQNMKPGQYTVSFKRSGYSGIEVTVGEKRAIINGGSSMYKGTFTVAMAEVVTISFSEGQNPNREQRIISDVMLTFGDHFGYELYKQGSDVKSMSFGQTVYGGVLDWISGLLTVTKEKVILNGSGDWSYDQSFNGYSTAKETKYKDAFLPLCNIAKGVSSNQTTGYTIRADYGTFRFQGFADSYPDLGSFKAFLQSQNAEIICELTEPFTVQLTQTEILALSGVNTLYANTGDTTVVGRADPNATISELKRMLCSTQNTANEMNEALKMILSGVTE